MSKLCKTNKFVSKGVYYPQAFANFEENFYATL